MHMIRKAAIGLAAVSIAIVPIAASAAPGMDGARATSAVGDGNELGGNSGWIIGLIGLLAGVAAIIIIDKNDDDAPTSP